MEILIFSVIIFVLVIIWLSKRRKYAEQKAEISKADVSIPAVTISIQDSLSNSFDNPDTGPIIPTPYGGCVLNPKSTFPLTVYGIGKSTAEELKGLLDAGYSLGTYAHASTIVPIIARSTLSCKEIDEYVKNFSSQYFSKIEELKRSSSEWASASARDQEDLLVSFRQQAIESLDVRPCCGDLETLFECKPSDITIDDALIDRFGYENLQLYLRYAGQIDKVRAIPADHYERGGFEKLVELGLARRGKDIPLPAILETLKLKEMNDLVADLNQKPFGRKAKAIESLVNLSDIQERVNRAVAFRELFQLNPLPDEFSNIDLNKISDAWRYANEVATLITHTYIMGGYSTQHMQQDLDPDLARSFFTGWELSPARDNATCQYCMRAASKIYTKKEYPTVPLHIGCRCTVLAKTEV